MKKLFRSKTSKVFAGICGGLGKYSEVDPVIWRLLFTFVAIATAVVPFLIFYGIIWILIPIEN